MVAPSAGLESVTDAAVAGMVKLWTELQVVPPPLVAATFQ